MYGVRCAMCDGVAYKKPYVKLTIPCLCYIVYLKQNLCLFAFLIMNRMNILKNGAIVKERCCLFNAFPCSMQCIRVGGGVCAML